MPKPWKEVIASPQYQSLSPQQQSEAQNQYFETVVAPQAGNNANQARNEFFSAYPPPSIDSAMESSAQQSSQPWPAQTPEPSLTENIGQAARGLAQSAVNVANIPAQVVNAALGAMGVPAENQVMQFSLPEGMRPTDKYAQIGAEIGPYLIPGLGAERTAAALSSVAGGGRAERIATQGASMLAENLPGALAQSSQNNDLPENLALGVAGSAAGRALIAAGGRVAGAIRNASSREGVAQAPIAEVRTPDYSPKIDTGAGQDFSPRGARYTVKPPTTQSAPEPTPPTQMSQNQDSIAQSYAGAAKVGGEGRISQVVSDIQPDKEVIDAARRLNLDPDDMLEAYTSGNDAFKAVQMGLASQDESMLAAVKRDSINRISARAAKIIDDAGAMPDRMAMSDKFRSDFDNARLALKAKESELYKPVQDSIPPRSEVNPKNTRDYLDNLADEQGGYEHLSTMEKKIYDKVAPKGEDAGAPTYARLNTARSIVGAELGKAGTPFGSAEERNLSQLYSMLSKDRDDVARAAGFSDQIKAANAVTAQRKMMENNVYSLLGKDLTGDVTVKAQSALNGLSTGNTKPFNQLINSIPDKGSRAEIIATGMRDMLRKGSRSDLANNINGFVDYYGALRRNGTDRLLRKELPESTMRELDDFYTLARNVKSANQYHLATGKLSSFLAKFESPGGFLDKLATHGKMATIATVLGHVPVAGPVLNTAIAAQMGAKAATQKTGASAVQEMMGSATWKKLVSAARSNPSPKIQERIVEQSEKNISQTRGWKEFYRTLPKEEKENIARVGIIGWLSGNTGEN